MHVYIIVHSLVKKYYIQRRRSVKGSLSCFISLVSFLTPSRDEKILRRRLFSFLFSALGLTYFLWEMVKFCTHRLIVMRTMFMREAATLP